MTDSKITYPEAEPNLPSPLDTVVAATEIDFSVQDMATLIASLKSAGQDEDGWSSPELLQAILDRGQEAVAPLLAFVEQSDFDQPSVYYAVELLIILKDPAALPALAQYFRNSSDDDAEALEMSLPEFGPALLPHFLPLIGDRSLTWYQRAMAIESMKQAVGDDAGLRRQIADAAHAALLAYVAEADTLPNLPEEAAAEFTLSVGSLVSFLADLEADSSRPLMKAAFDAGLVDLDIVDENVFDEEWGEEPRVYKPFDWLAWYRNAYAHRNDPLPKFREPADTDLMKRAGLTTNTYASAERYVPQQPYIAPPKPGRNDPCWCGSGKKYKKCHLGQTDDRFAGM